MFPGVRTDEITKALDNRRNNVKPSLPQVIGTSMDFLGQVTILFDQDIMMPEAVDNKFWNFLLEV